MERDAAKAKLQELLRRYFGRSSEKLDPNQLQLAWEAVESDIEIVAPPKPAPQPKPARERSMRRVRRMEELPVLEKVVVDLPDEQKIGPDGQPRVDVVTAIVQYLQANDQTLLNNLNGPRNIDIPAGIIPGPGGVGGAQSVTVTPTPGGGGSASPSGRP